MTAAFKTILLLDVPSAKMKLSLVQVHTQIAAEQHSEDAPASDWDQHLRHLLPSRIPDEGA